MNDKSSSKGKEKLIEDNEIFKSIEPSPLMKGQDASRDNAMVFNVYNPKEGETNVMAFQKAKKKSNKD